MVRGSFVRVCPAVVQCVRVLQITNKIMVHLWFGLRSGWFAGGSCESALQFCECMRLSQFARKIVVRWWLLRCSRLVHVVVHAWFVAGSLVRCWFLCSGPLFSLIFPIVLQLVATSVSSAAARPGAVAVIVQGWSLEAVCRAVPYGFSRMSRCDSLPPRAEVVGVGVVLRVSLETLADHTLASVVATSVEDSEYLKVDSCVVHARLCYRT